MDNAERVAIAILFAAGVALIFSIRRTAAAKKADDGSPHPQEEASEHAGSLGIAVAIVGLLVLIVYPVVPYLTAHSEAADCLRRIPQMATWGSFAPLLAPDGSHRRFVAESVRGELQPPLKSKGIVFEFHEEGELGFFNRLVVETGGDDPGCEWTDFGPFSLRCPRDYVTPVHLLYKGYMWDIRRIPGFVIVMSVVMLIGGWLMTVVSRRRRLGRSDG